MFRFKLLVASEDITGYFYIRWDKAQKIILIAKNREEAIKKAIEVMGEPECERRWTVKILDIEEVE